jgi:hypothetical protein
MEVHLWKTPAIKRWEYSWESVKVTPIQIPKFQDALAEIWNKWSDNKIESRIILIEQQLITMEFTLNLITICFQQAPAAARPFACWGDGFEFRRGMDFYVLSVVSCQIGVSVSRWSLA